MKRLLSVSCSDWAFNVGMLLLRLGAGALIIPHGYSKLVHFAEKKNSFMNFMGMGSTLSLALVIFAEFFCGMFIVIGLFTRLTVIPPVIVMFVALFKIHNGDIFGEGANAALFLSCFLTILLCGPGKASIDGLINK
jgi:putative oxidoreductase